MGDGVSATSDGAGEGLCVPYYPLWSIAIITLDVFVIWALTVHGRDVTRA